MKKLQLPIALLSALALNATIANAQWTEDASSVYLTNGTKNVGIGTVAPAFVLDIQRAGNASMSFKSTTGTANMILDRANNTATASVSYRTNGAPTFQTGTVGTDNFVIRNIFLGAPAFCVVQSNNNVGIATNTPSASFSVNNKLLVDAVNGDMSFSDQLGSITFPAVSGAADAMINMFASGIGNGDRMVIAHSPGFSTYGLQYQDATDKFNFIGNGSNVLTADLANLRVGIGSNAPTTKLHVVGASTLAGNTAVTGTLNVSGATTIGGILDVNGDTIRFGSVERLIDGGANTIATNSTFRPETDLGANLGSTIYRWNNVFAGNSVSIGGTSTVLPLHVDGGTDVGLASGGYACFGATTAENVTIDNNEIMARNNGAASSLFVQHSGGNTVINANGGAVCIGIGTPATGYLVSVDGKLIAEEVRVELSGNWPDYVFSNDYKMLSIEELENHIATYNHLPNVPSAAEVAADGIMLGEMQTKTMEKVEENALYIIELNNKLKAQDQLIQKLLKEVEALKNDK